MIVVANRQHSESSVREYSRNLEQHIAAMINTFFVISNLRVALFNWDATLNLAIMIITIYSTVRRFNPVIRP